MIRLSSGLPGTIAGPDFAPLEHRRPGAEVEAPLLLPEPVADRAAPEQDRDDVVLRHLAAAGAARRRGEGPAPAPASIQRRRASTSASLSRPFLSAGIEPSWTIS